MRLFLTLAFMLLPGLAFPHPGHLIEVAGHDHIAAGVAVGVAIGVAIWGVLKGRRDNLAEPEADEATDEEPQDA
ncbi:MAG: hypothetical protein AUK37_07890 [Rhodobacterales bacterium CG2_30_65_12]|nr:MAG: hypothetical protein AUK37_07890 [Rhodobacterales bacterium CG2_30_65_12]